MQSSFNYNKILIIQTAFTGDVILATAILEKLHRFYPKTLLDILVRKGNETLFTGHPYINEVIVWDKKVKKYKNAYSIFTAIRSRKYDLVINLQRFFMSGLLTVMSGAKEKRGYSKNPLSFLFSKKYPHIIKDGIHEVDRNNSLISDITDSTRNLPVLYPTAIDMKSIPVEKSYVSISPNSVWHTKQWPQHHWKELIKNFNPAVSVYLLGSSADFESCEAIRNAVKTHPVYNMAGKLSFLGSAALMKNAMMNFVNDSAPLHIATSVKAPVLAVYCSTVASFGFYPIAENGLWIETDEKLDCRPCGLHGYNVCPMGHFKCSHIPIEKLRLTLTDFPGIFS